MKQASVITLDLVMSNPIVTGMNYSSSNRNNSRSRVSSGQVPSGSHHRSASSSSDGFRGDATALAFPKSGSPSGGSWFAPDPSKAYYEKLSLVWAPTSMAILLAVVLGTPLYTYCDRNSYLIISILGCLPGFIVPLLFPCPVDRQRPFTQRFWVKGSLWISIFGFYGNYFWTHYFYQLLGAQYLFDSYRFNDVPLVTFTCTFFYFTFYFNLITVILRRIAYYTADFPPFGVSLLWWFAIAVFAYGTAVFEAVSVQHFPLYTYTERDAFLQIGSVVYGLYFLVGFPMFYSLDEPSASIVLTEQQPNPSEQDANTQSYQSHSLADAAVNALAATAIVTLLLDLWRLFLGSIYEIGKKSGNLPFVYQPGQDGPPVQSACSTYLSAQPTIVYVEKPVTVESCAGVVKSWMKEKVMSVYSRKSNIRTM